MLFLYRLSRQSVSWLILFGGALAPFLVALISQHWLGMPPCVLCICQRLALLGMVLSALLVLPAPQCRYLRALGVSLWGYSAFRGLLAAWEQMQRYLHPSQFIPCAFRVHFPEWLPLDSWIPQVFKAYAACEPLDWSLLGLNIPQWTVLLFSLHLFSSILMACCQMVGWKSDRTPF